MKKLYITTPIYYVNDSPHIGHAYTSIACDVLARFARQQGAEVIFLTGTDEHGQKVEGAARNSGVSTMEFCNKNSQKFKDLGAALNLSNDDFIRTTEGRDPKTGEITKESMSTGRHMNAAQEFCKKIYENGWIYKGKYCGWYAVRDEAFYAESELIDGKAPTGAEVKWQEEESYFFRLSEFQDILLKIFEEIDGFVSPSSKLSEVTSFVKGGSEKQKDALRDLCISRVSFNWGVPMPKEIYEKEEGNSMRGNKAHIMYVWLDALSNYISALNYPDGENYMKFWEDRNADSDVVMHMVGKDILRFHTVYWPAFLIAAQYKRGTIDGNNIDIQKVRKILPSKVYAHGWWTNNGQKISKSLGNTIDPNELVKKYSVDYVRYFLLKEIKFGEDGDYSDDALTRRVNSELVNNLGNLLQRTLSMIAKYCGGIIENISLSECRAVVEKYHSLEGEKLFRANIEPYNFLETYERQLLSCQFQDAICIPIELCSVLNKVIEKTAPWTMFKNGNTKEVRCVLQFCLEWTYVALQMLRPFLPSLCSNAISFIRSDNKALSLQSLTSLAASKGNFLCHDIAKLALPPENGFFARI